MSHRHPWFWWMWFWPHSGPCQPKTAEAEELIAAWEDHLVSTKCVAERAAQNVLDAERLTADLKALAERLQKQRP